MCLFEACWKFVLVSLIDGSENAMRVVELHCLRNYENRNKRGEV